MYCRSVVLAAVAAFLSVTSGVALADASAIAFGSNNTWGWATKTTQKEANSVALKLCNENNPKNDCKLEATKAVARAVGEGRIGYGMSVISVADAKRIALKSCRNADCKVNLTITDPGFYSLAKSEEDADGNANFHLAYQYRNSDKADADAIAECEKGAGRKCKIAVSGAIAGIYNTSVASHPVPADSEKTCRPNTPNIRCTSQCTNGDCIVTYENGCKMRVRVQPQFDPFNNRWNYPAPAC